MTDGSTSLDHAERTEGPEGASFFALRDTEGSITLPRHALNGHGPEPDREQTVTVIPFERAGHALHEFVRERWERFSVGLEKHPLTVCGERFRLSRLRECEGVPGALMARLRDEYGFGKDWIKAEPWPFPVPFGELPNRIDVEAVAAELGCTAFVYQDPHAGRGRPEELIMLPVFP